MIKISGELDDDDGEYGEDYDSNDVDPENDPEISNDNDQDNDPDNISESGEEYNPFECPDYDNPDPEYNPFECPDYDNPDQEYNPFKCPDYDNPDQEYNPFKCPDYDNEGKSNPSSPDTEGDEMDQIPRPFEKPVDEDEEEIEKEHGGDYAGVRQENSEKKDLEEIHEDLIREEENVDEPIEENSETEINQEAGNRAELDSKTPDHDSEMNSNIEITNINQEQSTTTIQQESLEQDKEHVEETQEEEPKSIERDPERIPIYNVEEFEISPDYEEIKKETQEEAREGIAEQEEENLQEQYQEQEEHVSQKSFERDKEGKIILDAEQMELFGGRVSSKEEMEVEILEEEMEELFDSYEERGVEQEQRLEISHEVGQERGQEQQELEQEIERLYTHQQEENVSQEMERTQEQELSRELSQNSQAEVSEKSKKINAKSMELITTKEELENYNPNKAIHRIKYSPKQEQKTKVNLLTKAKSKQKPQKVNAKKVELIKEKDEKENVQESSQKRIQEIEQELAQEKEQSLEQSHEIEQEFMQEAHKNVEVIREEIQEQVEEQKEQTLKESKEFFEERYKQETGRRPIHTGKETRGFIEWKEHLKPQEEKQEEKNKLLQEEEKEIKEQSKEIRESKEEWARYLANSIKEAEFTEKNKEELIDLLEKYEILRELLEKLKNKEIIEEEFEKEVKKFEHILIEKRYIARPLFMNFDWFRRYYNGMIVKAGKRVAHLYISKKTREFLSYISGRIKQLKNRENSKENAEKFKEFLEKSFQIKEKWALLLNNLIHDTPNKEISKEVKEELESVIKMYCEIRAILFNKNILEEDKEKLIQERIENCNPRFFELFEILKRFLGIYGNYNRNWMEQSLILEGRKTIRQLYQKIGNIKKKKAIHQILKEKNLSIQNFKEIIRQNLYKSIELNVNDKSKIIKIIQNEKFDEKNNVKLTNILSKLSIEELISLLGDDFKQYSQTYMKNRYRFNEIKKIIIFDFLAKKIIEQDKEDSDIAKYIKPEEKNSFRSNSEKTYIIPLKWFRIKNSVLRQIREILRDRNIKVKEINIIIGSDFSKISKGRAMKEESFFKLNNLVGKDTLLKLFNQDFIPHDVYIGHNKYVPLERNEVSAEFMAIMLGDGHLDKDGSSTSIALNIIDDPDYVKYVKNEIIDKLFKKNSFFVEDFNCKHSLKRFELVSKKKSVHYAIYELGKSVRKTGLIPGNKVKNQVSVPDWIYYDRSESKILIISSLRGLFDTDGSISVNKKRNTLNLAFSNSSLPLCEDFIHMCSILDIRTGDVIKCHKENGNTEYQVFISSKSQVQEFLNKIKPRKIKERKRRIFLGCQLIFLSLNRDIIESVEHKIKIWKRKNNEKKFKYTKKNANLLKFWCETEFLRNNIKSIFEYPFIGKITDEMIDKAILKALEYRYTKYDIEIAKFYVDLYKRLGNLSRMREYLRDIGNNDIPDKETIKKYIIQYLEEEKEIDSINFLKRNKITNIILYECINRIKSFPKKLRNVICGVLYDKLLNFSVNVKNSLIIEQLKAYFINNEILLMNWLLDENKNFNFSQALTSYFNDLIFLIKEILKQHTINRHINIQSLSRIKEMPFKYSVIREILNYLISVKNLK